MIGFFDEYWSAKLSDSGFGYVGDKMVFENSCFAVILGSEVGGLWLIPLVVLRVRFDRRLVEFVGGGTRVGFDRDAGDSQRFLTIEAVVSLVFGAEVQSVVSAEVFQNPVEVYPAEGDLVLGQRKGEHFVGGLPAPLPAIEPRKRESIRGAIGLSQD
jgi:hypothetical protein